jgi:hypothetical protein
MTRRWSKGIRTHDPTMNGAQMGGRLEPINAIAREDSLSFRHLTSVDTWDHEFESAFLQR